MAEVTAYVKNANLGLTVPYTIDGEQREYWPDFIVRIDDGHDEPLNLIVEVSGPKRRDKEAKIATMHTQWVPAVNAHGGFGRWAFVDVDDPTTVKQAVRAAAQEKVPA